MKNSILTLLILSLTFLFSCKKKSIIVDPVEAITYSFTYVDSTGNYKYPYSGPMDNLSKSNANAFLKQRFKFDDKSTKELEVFLNVYEDSVGNNFHVFNIDFKPMSSIDTNLFLFAMDSNIVDTIEVVAPKWRLWGGRDIFFNGQLVVKNDSLIKNLFFSDSMENYKLLLINDHKIFIK